MRLIESAMFTLTVLGSGSAGNCALVRSARCRLLIDGGLSARQTALRLAQLGLSPDELDGVLLTHEHGDHAGGLEVLCRKHDVPIFCTSTTAETLRYHSGADGGLGKHGNWRLFAGGRDFTVGDIAVQTFAVPHDAVDPVGFVLHCGEAALGYLTDLGHATKLVIERVKTVGTLLIECNHDTALLNADTKRPWSVKQRITSRHGHLSNEAAASVVAQLLCAGGGRLRRAVLGHLSRDCNTPARAIAAVRAGAAGATLEIVCAEQKEVSAEFVVEAVAVAAPPLPEEPADEMISARVEETPPAYQFDLFAA